MTIASRDSGLSRVSRITRWTAAGGMALAGTFAVMMAKAQPGRINTQPSSAAQQQSTPSTALTQDDAGLQPPVLAPAPSSGTGQVVSGGS